MRIKKSAPRYATMRNLLDHGPRTATVTALEDVEAFVLDPRSFSALLDEHGVARRILSAEVDRLRAADSVQIAAVQA